ncbi:AsmA family protein [Thaumasiovibrio sp. DFM-14]|uniref:AsmA family protein n=1 Tax=Thaumasiovibrio sp. DFM-14 TaxID=3384792 RepID=UPI0039A14F95
MKKLIVILLGIVITLVIALAALIALVDPNQFKPVIVEQVEENTGQTLVIDGELKWQWWPRLGLSMGETALRNPTEFTSTDMLAFQTASLSVEVLPLFSRTLSVGELTLIAPQINVETLPDGRRNIDALLSSDEEEQTIDDNESQGDSDPSQQAKEQPWSILLAGIRIEEARVMVIDQQRDETLLIEPVTLNLSAFSPGEWAELAWHVGAQTADMQVESKGAMELLLQDDMQSFELRKVSSDITAKMENFTLTRAQLDIPSFRLAEPSVVNFSMVGETGGEAFDVKLATELNVSTNYDSLRLTNLDSQLALETKAVPSGQINATVSTDVELDLTTQQVALSELVAQVNDTQLAGVLSVNYQQLPALRFDLSSPAIDLDDWVAESEDKATEPDSKPATSNKPSTDSSASQEPDLSGLKGLDVKGRFSVAQFKGMGLAVNDINVDLAIQNGVLNVSKLAARLYGGSVNGSLQLDARAPVAKYQVKQHLDGVEVQPLLIDLAENDSLSGTGRVDIALSGTGLSEAALRRNSRGTVALNLADGSVNGVNIAEMIREARATLKGQRDTYVEEERKTDFTALSGTISIANGVASNRDLTMSSPLLRINGRGQTNLVNERIDYVVEAAVVESSKGQGGKGTDELNDIVVPINVSGTWSAPSYKLDVEELLKQNLQLENKAKREIERGLEKLLGEEGEKEELKKAADQLLKGLFR